MKQLFFAACLLLISYNSTAQQSDSQVINVSGLSVNIENNQISIEWKADVEGSEKYWEVQGSQDGKSYSTIGFVMGEDPKNENAYRFKNSRVRKEMKYYRVMQVEGDWAVASKPVAVK